MPSVFTDSAAANMPCNALLIYRGRPHGQLRADRHATHSCCDPRGTHICTQADTFKISAHPIALSPMDPSSRSPGVRIAGRLFQTLCLEGRGRESLVVRSEFETHRATNGRQGVFPAGAAIS